MIFIQLALLSIEKMLHKLVEWLHVGLSIGGGFILNILIIDIGNVYFRWFASLPERVQDPFVDYLIDFPQ